MFVILSLLYTYIGGVKAFIWLTRCSSASFLGGGLSRSAIIRDARGLRLCARAGEAAAAGKLVWLNHPVSLTFSAPF